MTTPAIGVVWNPSKTDRDALDEAFAAVSREPTWYETSPDDPGIGATARALADGAELIVAAGGDGTVRAVIDALASAERDTGSVPADLCIIPLGTGNLLARNLGIPLGDPEAALTHAVDAPAGALDVGWITLDDDTTRHAFAVMAGFGIDAHMITETDDDLKSQVGWMAYVESLGRAVSASEVIDVTLVADGGEARDDTVHTLIVGNCGSIQAGIALLPDADPTDGRLDLLMLNADTVTGWLDTLHNMVWANGVRRLFGGTEPAADSTSVTHTSVTTLAIDLGTPRVFEVDGDELSEASRAVIEIQAGAVRVRGA